MITTVHVHPKVEKIIEQMKTLDNTPAIAALRAQDIINALVHGVTPALAGRLSKKKDARIKNLFKFNLGKGFRLITIKEQDAFYILFIGDHDLCDRWLDTNSKKKPHKTSMPLNVYDVSTRQKPREQRPVCNPQDEDNVQFFADITQEDLRKVFCGLAGSA